MIALALRRCAALTRTAASEVRRTAAAFGADRGGNVAIIFALALIPVLGGVGVDVDYSSANNAPTEMQAALDVTALMISREALDLKSGQVQKKARTYFNAQFDRPYVKNVNPTFALQNNGPGDYTVIAEASGYIDATIAQVLGKKTIDLRVTTQVRWSFKSLELALALDNIGSMAGKSKMVELKSAVK